MTKRKSNKPIVSLWVLSFLSVALFGAMFLVQTKQDTRNFAAGCKEQCPGADGVLRNCTPPEDDGSSADSLCAWAGRSEPCGGKQFCCPSAGEKWTTVMTACAPSPTASPSPEPTPTVEPSPTRTPAPTRTPTPTSIPTPTDEPTLTATPTTAVLTPTPTTALTLTPTMTVTGTPGSAYYLKFKMSFAGVQAAALCADPEKMPLNITVRAADGTSKYYPGIIPRKETSSIGSSPAIYTVGIRLEGFNYKNNLTVFIRGPKHLQVKYGKDDQNYFYNLEDGQLSGLTKSESTTPTFDFSGYPLLAGDVTGATSGVQDGVIDGYDFSYIKNEAVKRTSVAPHSYMLADINGNCEMESSDLTWLMLSLIDKQEQFY